MAVPKGYKFERKKSSRTKGVRTNSGASAALKAKWADPVWRAARLAKPIGAPKGNKHRLGVPDGMRKRDAVVAWAQAEEASRKFIKIMEEAGKVLPDEEIVPGSEQEMAKNALAEAYKHAVSPMTDMKSKSAFIRVVLDFTKAKPESKSKLTLEKSDEWLALIQADMKGDAGKPE